MDQRSSTVRLNSASDLKDEVSSDKPSLFSNAVRVDALNVLARWNVRSWKEVESTSRRIYKRDGMQQISLYSLKKSFYSFQKQLTMMMMLLLIRRMAKAKYLGR